MESQTVTKPQKQVSFLFALKLILVHYFHVVNNQAHSQLTFTQQIMVGRFKSRAKEASTIYLIRYFGADVLSLSAKISPMKIRR